MPERPQEAQRQMVRDSPRTLAVPKPEKFDETKYDEDGNLLEKEALKLQKKYYETHEKFQKNVGEQLMDIDGFSRKLMNEMPNLPSEIMYKIALNNLSKVFGVFFVMGMLMIVTVVAYSVSWGVRP